MNDHMTLTKVVREAVALEFAAAMEAGIRVSSVYASDHRMREFTPPDDMDKLRRRVTNESRHALEMLADAFREKRLAPYYRP